MIPIGYLAFFLIVVLAIQIFVLRMELMSPSFLYTGSFLVCTLAACILQYDWGLSYLYKETVSIICMSVIVVLVIDSFFNASRHAARRGSFEGFKAIDLPSSIIYVTIVLNMILFGAALIRSGAVIASTNMDLNAIMSNYKESISYGNDRGSVSFVVSQFGKVASALTYIESFIIINNIGAEEKISGERKSRIALLIVLAISYIMFRLFFNSSRQSSIHLIVGMLVMYYICITATNNQHERLKRNFKALLLTIIVAVIIMFAFYYLGRIVGRKLENAALDASIGYLATGILGLNDIVGGGFTSNYWGEKTFTGAANMFQLVGVWPNEIGNWSMLPFFRHGNTVTILGRWYWDFGYIGTLVMISVIALIFCLLYHRFVRFNKNGFKRNLSVVLYGFFVHILFFAGYDDFSFNLWTLNYAVEVFVFLFVYQLVFREGESGFNNLGRSRFEIEVHKRIDKTPNSSNESCERF